MDTLANLHRKVEAAGELKSIVRTMKAMAASNIGQYEKAVNSLEDYYRTIALGMIAYLKKEKINNLNEEQDSTEVHKKIVYAIVFGSDQGLVGQFNDLLAEFVFQSLNAIKGKKEIWAVGERVQLLLSDTGFTTTKLFSVPNSVNAITPLVGQILIRIEEIKETGNINEFYIFHNQSMHGINYKPVSQRLLPLDKKWMLGFAKLRWPTKNIPQVAGDSKSTLSAIINEYLFVSLFKACAESLASENSSRLNAMQRAEKNIDKLLEDLNHKFHSLRQSSIDEELFDVISGFEALKNNFPHKIKEDLK